MLDLLLVLAFVVYALASGLRSRRRASQGLQEYFLAGRSVPGWKAGMSMAATQFAADTPLLVTGLVATAGVFAVWRLWIYALAFLLMAYVFAVGWRRAGVLTDAELTELRYSGRGVLAIRVIKAVYYGTVINCAVMAMVLVAAVRIAEVFLPWHRWLPAAIYQPILSLVATVGLELGGSALGGDPLVATTNNLVSIVVIVLFTATYSTTGGLRAVIDTDVVQLALALVGSLAYAVAVLLAVGGFGELSRRVVELYGEAEASRMLSFAPPTSGGPGELLVPFLVVVSLQWFFQMNADGTGYLAQRAMACRTDRDARVAAVAFAWVQIFLRSVAWLVIAAGLLVLHPFTGSEVTGDGFAASREILFVVGIDELLPPGIRGLMLVGLLAALASTIDTHLNWGASYWTNDVYDRLVCRTWLRREPRPRELVAVARLSSVVLVLVALAVMTGLGSIQTAWFVSLLFGAGVGSVLVLRWLWERINLYSEIAAMIASLVVAPVVLVTMGSAAETEWIRLAIMAVVSTAAAVGVTFVTPPTNDATLLAFYRRVQPFGFWSRTAALAGDRPEAPRTALAVRLRAAVLTAASLLLALVGVGRLLVSPPDASTSWSVLLIVAGAALVPLWWPAVAREDLGIDRTAGPPAGAGAERRR